MAFGRTREVIIFLKFWFNVAEALRCARAAKFMAIMHCSKFQRRYAERSGEFMDSAKELQRKIRRSELKEMAKKIEKNFYFQLINLSFL